MKYNVYYDGSVGKHGLSLLFECSILFGRSLHHSEFLKRLLDSKCLQRREVCTGFVVRAEPLVLPP